MKKRLLIGILACIISVAGYGFYSTGSANNEASNVEPQIKVEQPVEAKAIEDKVDKEEVEEIEVEEVAPATAIDEEIPSSNFSLDQIAAYSGSPYITVNNNIPYFSDEDKVRTDAFEIFSNLDSLGRCGVAYANICKELMPTEERGEIGSVRPSGWHTANYHEYVDGNYLYNRCHLIGYQLSGENANEKNLITGTRYLNVVGMLPFENEVDDYVDSTGNHVLYRVTPIFEGNNLVASGVLMEAYSVEDQGKGVMFNVYCYNVQPNIVIDYATGESELAAGATSVQEQQVSTDATEQSQVVDFVLNTNTKKFHTPTCGSVSDMKDKNKQYFHGTREELINQGYDPCGRCNP
ncbi:DNA-entry nuclease [Pseudobutyrivibrio sp. C4]|uniref:DNA/RNA non-specific endonuclease n=1 Tax=Pseudobutyrivibrio sp. C4 TaxID=1520803 RepID=UPI0008BED005|nr:DNA/RNA non-specific endonuclease [Pseudobutyrivibrio sp. C4]SES91562.1 DNA-entry nuclease [Pseudobutyrivibrio sp. C4]